MTTNGGDPRVADFTRRRFGAAARAVALEGDASDRRFFRLKAPGLSPLILMVHAEPFDVETLPFFQHARFLHAMGAAVPQIVASYPADGILVVQDLGDDTLQKHLEHCDASRRRFLYHQAVQMIASLQRDGTRALTPDLPASNTALDAPKLLWELEFFRKHYVEGLLGSPLETAQSEELARWCDALAKEVAGYPSVLCHRDYHSRNLMVKGDQLFMVDFQDARRGPYTYDLASLLRDSYVRLPEDLVEELIGFFREASQDAGTKNAFRRAFARTCLQRNIKAVGTFASQAMLRGNRGYLRYIPPTLESVRARLGETAGDADATAIRELFDGPLAFAGEAASA
jgi:aminoglycoside/choline kinase family phosphotransferase